MAKRSDDFNPDDQAVRFDLSFYDETGTLLAKAEDEQLPAKALLQVDDIVRWQKMIPQITTNPIGMLRVDVDSPIVNVYPVIAQRNYSDGGDENRFGQGVLGFAAAKANVRPGKPAIIPAVRRDQNYYSNVGLVNVSATDASVLVTFLDGDKGAPIFALPLTLKPNESKILMDLVKFFNEQTNRVDDRGSIKLEVTNDSTVWAFASIIDSITKDPEYVPAIPLY